MGGIGLSPVSGMKNYTQRMNSPEVMEQRIQGMMKQLEKANQTTKDGRYRIMDGKLVPVEGYAKLVPANMRGVQSNQESMQKSKKSRLEKKRLCYSYKKLSSAIRASKTSGNAHLVVTKAKLQVSDLKRKRGSESYDDVELEMAISHAMSVERVARKHEKNLRMEELAKRGEELVLPALDPEEIEEIDSFEEEMESFTEDMEFLAEEMTSFAENMEMDLFDMMQDLLAFSEDMDEEDIREMEKRHRSAEDRDLAKADMEYLKNYFEYLNSQCDAGVRAESGGAVADFMA